MRRRIFPLAKGIIVAAAFAFPSCAPHVETIREPVAPIHKAERRPALAPKPNPDNIKAIELIGDILDGSRTPMSKKTAVETLGMIAATGNLSDAMVLKAAQALLPLLHDEDPGLRDSSVISLGQLRYMDAWQYLADALKDPSPDVRRHAAEALGKLKNRNSVGPLIGLSQDKDVNTRLGAVFALGEIKSPKSIGALIMALDDPALDVKIQAAVALGKLGDKEALPALKKHCRGKLKEAARAAIEDIENRQE
jgi:HEAT repeat protein